MTIRQAEFMYKCLDLNEPDFSNFVESRYNGYHSSIYTMCGRSIWIDPHGKECKKLVLSYYNEHGLNNVHEVIKDWNKSYAYSNIIPTYDKIIWR